MGLKQMETTAFDVGDITFYVTPFPAMKSAGIFGELTSVLAPVVSGILPFLDKIDDLEELDAKDAAGLFQGCVTLSGDKVEKLVTTLLLGGNVAYEEEDEDGDTEAVKLTKDRFNELFCGDLTDMFELCFDVIKLNYNDFFEKLVGLSGVQGSARK